MEDMSPSISPVSHVSTSNILEVYSFAVYVFVFVDFLKSVQNNNLILQKK